MKNTELTPKFKICLDQIEELRMQIYLKLTVSESDGPIVHSDQSKIEGKLSFFGSKSANGMKCFDFQTINRNKIS